MKKSVGKKQTKEFLQLLDLPFTVKSGYFSSNPNILHFKGSFQSLKRSKNAKILWILCIL